MCKMCLNHVCSRCSRTEEVENEQGIVTQVPVCHVCYKQVQDKYTRGHHPREESEAFQLPASNRTKNDVVMVPSTTSGRHICQCGQIATAPCAVCTTWTCGPCSGIENVQVDGSHVFDLQLCHACSNKNQKWRNKLHNPKPIILHEKAPADIHKLGAMIDSISVQDHEEKALRKTKSVLLFDPEMPIPQDGPEEDAARHSSKDSSSSHSHDTYHSPTQPVVSLADEEVKEESVVDQLRHFACLDVGSNDLHDKICESAALELQCNNAYVTLIYQGSYILKGGFGPSVPAHLPSDCQLTAATLDNVDKMTVVPDALAEKRFQQSPRVVGKEKIRFYCGLPIVTMDGHILGTVSIADSSPRLRLSSAHIETMYSFRDAILELIESRLQLALEIH
ncbi:hypothetical protein THRCLA_23261 [Thraustotheca clavata]|uniref:GAF domain-containing protein n=1 Tax=Thraustotheca clavata TaxID=74557 RepID=A0A1V9Y8D9_9STRA|nr:hypothetical protein THRCLA_23261 [Thraustotheca clavata]